ncbi:MAG: glycosyltransferase family 1 protein [Proteobacteria bacterium]|nr:glycosyltransferase family 1 protein [Pseudomonadota bacterium]
MSRRFLFALWEGGGNVPPTMGAVRRLLARGHAVRVLGDDALRGDIEAAGAAFVPWRTAPNRPDRSAASDYLRDWEPQEPGGDLLRVLDRVMIGPAAAYAADTFAELARAPADAVVSCDLLFGPMMAAEAFGAPLAVFAPNVSVLPLPGLPPMGPGMGPIVTEDDRAQAAAVAGWFAQVTAERLPVLNAARAGLGLAPLSEAFDQVRNAGRVLLATSRAFDFPSEAVPANLRYVGPVLDQPGWTGGWASPWDAGDARPLVLVSMSSTFQNQGAPMQRVLDALAPLPVRVLATLGPALASAGALRVPDNAVAVAAAPHDAVMPHAAAVVTHCGHGTVMRALALGKPMLCLPMGRDQNDNAARVALRGAGLRLAPTDTVETICAAMRRLLDEPHFAEAARTLGQAIAAAEPAHALVDELEALAESACCGAAA